MTQRLIALTVLGWLFAPLTVAQATQVPGQPFDAYQVTYASNLNIGDSVIRLTNTGANGAPLFGPGLGDDTGKICANVYTFSPDEQMASCCSCPVTPNGLVTLSVRRDLISNPLTGVVPTSVTIKLLATQPAAGTCDPSTPTADNLTSGLKGWRTTVHQLPTGGFVVTDIPTGGDPTVLQPLTGCNTYPNYCGVPPHCVSCDLAGNFLCVQLYPNCKPLAYKPGCGCPLEVLSVGELTSLTQRCSFILGNGTSSAICNSCRAGGPGGPSVSAHP